MITKLFLNPVVAAATVALLLLGLHELRNAREVAQYEAFTKGGYAPPCASSPGDPYSAFSVTAGEAVKSLSYGTDDNGAIFRTCPNSIRQINGRMEWSTGVRRLDGSTAFVRAAHQVGVSELAELVDPTNPSPGFLVVITFITVLIVRRTARLRAGSTSTQS